jgi:CheY-like chemotaxis protein
MPFKYRILIVDDEPSIRATSELLLTSKGYEVKSAADGFAALVELRRSLPDLIISDLKMPNKSGFALLSIARRRFPQIVIIAISGEYDGIPPQGLIADAFLSKGSYSPDQLFRKIADLLESSPLRPHLTKPDKAPVWIPRNTEGYFVVTCTECLRSSPVEDQPGSPEVREVECIYCESTLRFLANGARNHKMKKSSAGIGS